MKLSKRIKKFIKQTQGKYKIDSGKYGYLNQLYKPSKNVFSSSPYYTTPEESKPESFRNKDISWRDVRYPR